MWLGAVSVMLHGLGTAPLGETYRERDTSLNWIDVIVMKNDCNSQPDFDRCDEGSHLIEGALSGRWGMDRYKISCHAIVLGLIPQMA